VFNAGQHDIISDFGTKHRARLEEIHADFARAVHGFDEAGAGVWPFPKKQSTNDSNQARRSPSATQPA